MSEIFQLLHPPENVSHLQLKDLQEELKRKNFQANNMQAELLCLTNFKASAQKELQMYKRDCQQLSIASIALSKKLLSLQSLVRKLKSENLELSQTISEQKMQLKQLKERKEEQRQTTEQKEQSKDQKVKRKNTLKLSQAFEDMYKQAYQEEKQALKKIEFKQGKQTNKKTLKIVRGQSVTISWEIEEKSKDFEMLEEEKSIEKVAAFISEYLELIASRLRNISSPESISQLIRKEKEKIIGLIKKIEVEEELKQPQLQNKKSSTWKKLIPRIW